MLVTASALALWSYDQTLIFETSRPLKSELWKGILKGKILISFALSLTGAMLLVECIVKRRRFILQPGHVFLCCYGVTSLLFIFGSKYVGMSPRISFFEFLQMPMPPEQLVDTLRRIFDVLIIQSAIALLFYARASTRFRGAWQFGFLLMLVSALCNVVAAALWRTSIFDILRMQPGIQGLLDAILIFYWCTAICAILLIGFACCVDIFRLRRQRDWKHWLGLSLLIIELIGERVILYLSQVF